MRSLLAVLVFLVALVGCAQLPFDQEQPHVNGVAVSRQALEHPAWPHETVAYRCEDGAKIQVAYLNLEGGESYAALYYDDRLSLMRPWPAASGARYISLDEQVGLRWHAKGDQGVLSFLAADHTAKEITLLSDCRAMR